MLRHDQLYGVQGIPLGSRAVVFLDRCGPIRTECLTQGVYSLTLARQRQIKFN